MPLEFTEKQPSEAYAISFNFSSLLESTETIASATLTAIDQNTRTDVTETLLDDTKQSETDDVVYGWVQNGTAGSSYIITCTIVGSLGSTYELDGFITVIDYPKASTITVGTNSWVTLAEAEVYFAYRMGSSDYWDEGAEKVASVVTAYKWLNAGKFSFPTTATQAMKDAQCEMALFLLQHQPDLDLRMGLQAQGVIAAGVVKERYKDDNYVEMPIPPVVQRLLADYDTDRPVYLVNIERNEEESVSYDAYSSLIADEAED